MTDETVQPGLFGSRMRPAHVDVVVTAALAVDLVLESALATGIPHRLLTCVVAVLFAAPIAVRRRWPTAAVIAAPAVCLVGAPFREQLSNLPSGNAVLVFMLLSYGAGAWLGLRLRPSRSRCGR